MASAGTSGTDDVQELLADPQTGPRAHPVATAEHLFEYSQPVHTAPHLLRLYNALFKAASAGYPDALRRIAALMPRGHGKTEGGTIVFPTWAITRWPGIKIAVISKTQGSAAERVRKVGSTLERHGERLGITLAEQTKTQITTRANAAARHKEPTMSAHGINSQITGGHYDVVIFDDPVDWENQRLESRRQKIRNAFRDYSKNLLEKDSALPTGPVTVAVGTRKHPQDLYETEILGNRSWKVFVERALSDWSIVSDRGYKIRAQDGNLYDEPADIPPGVDPVENGIVPDRDVDVLWPELKPLPALLYDIAFGDDAPVIWKRENQNDPAALQGTVFKSDWLTYTDELPGDPSTYTYYAGFDVAVVEDAQAAAEGNSDYSALAVLADSDSRQYLTHLWHERGLSVQDNADWAARKLRSATVGDHSISPSEVRVETNKAPGVAQTLQDDSPYRVRGEDSTGAKEGRLHDLSAEFQRGDLLIVGDSTDRRWRDFEQQEWLQFPNAAHDDRLDAIEIALRNVQTGGKTERVGNMRDLF